MKTLEDAIKDKKEELEVMEVPAELETRLRQALHGRKRHWGLKPVAAILAAVLLLTYSLDSIAYYGKKIAGYEQIATGSLKQFTEEGKGQQIGRSCVFGNGVEITVDGIMFDDKELVVFYKARTSQGRLEDILGHNLPRLQLYGIKPGGYYFKGGHGYITDERTMSFVDTLEAPAFYEKWIKLSVQLVINKKVETHYINFTLNRNNAMKRTVKVDLNAEAKLGDYRILFDRLDASAMGSVLDGRIIPLTYEALKAFKPEGSGKGMDIPVLRFDIISDKGGVSQFIGGQGGVSGNDIGFSLRSGPLPVDFMTLQIKNIRFETMRTIDKTIDISTTTKNLQVAEDLLVKRVYRDGDFICVAISSRGIPVMGMFAGAGELEPVNGKELEREAESSAPVEKVYKFKGQGNAFKLSFKSIRYSKYSADVIKLPVGD